MILVAAAVALAWLLAPTLAATRRRVTAARAERRRRWEASEACAFEHVTEAIDRGDPAAVYPALLRWLVRDAPREESVTVATLGARVNDPELGHALAALGATVYGHARAPTWDARDLARRLGEARARLRHADHAARAAGPLPPLNP